MNTHPRPFPRPCEGTQIPVSVLGVERRKLEIWICNSPLSQESFPPCVKILIESMGGTSGKNRLGAVLAAFLGQAGWEEVQAKQIWDDFAVRYGLRDKRIFGKWFRRLRCPRCSTLQAGGRGYPDMGLADLGFCKKDNRCNETTWPVGYAAGAFDERDEKAAVLGRMHQVREANLARLYDWASGREGVVEISDDECRKLQEILSEKKDRQICYSFSRSGRIRHIFSLVDSQVRREVLSERLKE